MPLRVNPISGLVAGAAVACAAWSVGAAGTVRPGLWSTTDTVTSPIHTSKTENRCITPKAIARFTGCYINHHYKCTCPEQSNTGGKIVFHGDCVDAKGRHVIISGAGTYTPTTLQLSAEGHFTMMGLNVPFATHTDSHWIADTCPAGSPGSDGR
ncbi:MAG: DUF3617 domain-containing protein [Caulobacteraceae bacterium]